MSMNTVNKEVFIQQENSVLLSDQKKCIEENNSL